MPAHRMATPIPLIERTHDANAVSIWGPNGKADAADAIDRCEMGSEFLVCVPMCPLGQQMDVDLAEQRRKPIWIINFVIVPADREAQPIGKRTFGVQAAREKTTRVDAIEFQSSFAGPCVDDRGRVSFRMKCTDHHATRGVRPVHTQRRERFAVVTRDNRRGGCGVH